MLCYSLTAYKPKVECCAMSFDPLTLLQQVFPGMDETALVQMARIAKQQGYPADTVLCHEGALEEVFYILGEGQVIVTQQLGDEERFLRYSEPGQYFGEMALIANSPRNANVRTTVDSSVLEIDKDAFIEMMRQNPIIALTMFRTSVGWLRSNDTAAIAALSRQKAELQQAYDTLRIQERQRSEFLTTMAHELRTPLTSASGYMQLIRSGSLNGPALQVGLEKVSSGMQQIVSLINDLLFVQEMELIKPAMRAVNVADVLVTIAHEAQERAAVNHLTILIDAPDALPTVEADPDGLLRALRALLDNAIKFSPGGGEIRVNATGSDNILEIALADPRTPTQPDFMPLNFHRYALVSNLPPS